MLTRRVLLQTGSASIVVFASGCATSSANSKISFRQPWSQASEGFGDVRLNALAYAILAPNPHNRQPWRVRLEEDQNALTLFCDTDRLLPQTDPFDRQITIGLGAFLELFRQASAQQGYKAEVIPFPDGEPQPRLDKRPIARINLIENSTIDPDPLFGHVLARRTVRDKFSTKPISQAELEGLKKQLTRLTNTSFEVTTDEDKIDRIKALCLKGWSVEVGTKRTHEESTALTRIGAKEVTKNPDGISLLGPMMEILRATGVLRREKMNTPGTRAYDGAVSFYNDLIHSSQAFGWLSSPGNSRGDQLNAGADWVNLNLAATKLGIAMHPLSQVLQEFPEMNDLYAAFHKEVSIETPARVQGLFRFGFADYPKAAPRWPMMSSLIKIGE